MRSRINGRWVALLAALLCWPAVAPAQEDDQPTKVEEASKQVQVRVMRVQDEDQDTGNEKGTFKVEVREGVASKYWIGVLCEPVESELVKSQLGIQFGLVLEDIIKGGPAEEAKLKKFDILTKVDGKPLDGLPMLGQCIAKSEGKQLELTVIREGKPLQLTITPAKRPEKYQAPLPETMKDDPRAVDELKLLQQALRLRGFKQKEGEEMEDRATDGRTSLYYFLPGIVLSGGEDFPKDLEVTVTKAGGEPTKVTVKRGDEKWEVDEKSLEKLPEDIRPHIKRMLGSGQVQMEWSAKPYVLESLPNWKQFKFDPEMNLKIEKKLAEAQFEKKFAEAQLQMMDDLREKLEKQLDELQQKVEKAEPAISSEVLDQLRRDVTKLRKELERMHADRVKGDDRD